VPVRSVNVHAASLLRVKVAHREARMDQALRQKIAALPALNKAQLVVIWRENFQHPPPPNLRKELMVPVLAYRMQEKEFGGLSHTARKRLRELAASLNSVKQQPDAKIQDGTRLVRTWRGEVHEVAVTDTGFTYRRQHFTSLSRIAREITGTPWSGPLFFGTRKKTV
jgi:Protein of unknown function (DUF2924)